MQNLKDFKEEKQKLLAKYELVEKMNIFPIDNITLNDFSQKKYDLISERFFVSCTGQVKAGKSTLLNALLFQGQVLPVDDLPETAKITTVNYSDEPFFTIDYYTVQEWEMLKVSTIKIDDETEENFYDYYLRQEINDRAINPEEFVGKLPETIRGESNFSKLGNFVGKNGKLTPFVKMVNIGYPSDILKDVTFVDTPGINDPNPVRTKVTTDWIHKTDANIFLTYAGQAFSEQDLIFIDQYLFGVETGKKIMVVNKIDAIDPDRIDVNYINRLKQNPDLENRKIFGDYDSVVAVSGLGALIDIIYQKTGAIPENMQIDAERLENLSINYLDPENYNLQNLSNLIERKLIQNKGQNLIETKGKYLNGIFDKKLRIIKMDKEKLKDRLIVCSKNAEELESGKTKLQESIGEINGVLTVTQASSSKKVNDEFNKNQPKLITCRERIKEDIKYKLRKIKIVNHFSCETKNIIKTKLDEAYKDINSIIDDVLNEAETHIKNKLRDAENAIGKYKTVNFSLLSHLIEFAVIDIWEDMKIAKAEADDLFKASEIEKIIQKATSILQRWFNTDRGLDDVISSLDSPVSDFFNKFFDNFYEKVLQMKITESINKIIGELSNEIIAIQQEKLSDINTIMNNLQSQKSIISDIQNDIKLREEQEKVIENYKQDVIK